MSEQLQWIETLDLHGPTNADGLKPDQGAELEKAMYDAAALSVKEGYKRLSQLKVPASRRLDYFAEMLKTDRQMTKIRTHLVQVQQRIESVEGRKKRQAQKKFSKQIRAAKIEKKKADTAEKKNAKPAMKSSDKKEFHHGQMRKGGKNAAKKGFKKNASHGKGKTSDSGPKKFGKVSQKGKIFKKANKSAGKFNSRK